MPRRVCRLLVTDLDNTVWDWVEIWTRSFRAMLTEAARISGLDEEVLLDEIREVHREHRTTEYADVLEELPSLRRLHGESPVREVYRAAMAARAEAQDAACIAYRNVRATLELARRRGTRIVGYTESMTRYTARRLRTSGLQDLFDAVYASPDHVARAGLVLEAAEPELAGTLRETPKDAPKPNPETLRRIIAEVGGDPTSTVYVGDSLAKDIVMAREAGAIDVWARYGRAPRPGHDLELLRRVTHWTESEIRRERETSFHHVEPSYVIDDFEELGTFLEFRSP